MYLNMRLPRFSILAYIPWYNPSPSSSTSTPLNTNTNSKIARRPSTNTVMAAIPLSSNPRGELIFSSRVDQSFREGYERYRAAFERRREEKQREERGRSWRWRRTGSPMKIGVGVNPTPPSSRRGTPPPSAALGGRAPSPGVIRGSALRGEGGRADTGGLDEGRGRSDSYSFVLAGPGSREPSLRPDR
jgi:hypothetical protein